MKEKSQVSVIVPVYNPPEDYLKKCIESIQNQTYKNLDIILVDNEATGANPKILKDYAAKDDRINLIVFDKNKGFAGAVNAGLRASKGDYIAIIDSDDWIEDNAIEILAAKLDNSDLDMTIFCARTFDEVVQDFTDEPAYTFFEIPAKYDNSYFTFKDVKDFILHFPTQAWNKFYRKKFIFDNNNFVNEEQGSAGADALFTFYNYLNAKQIGIVREKLYNYRVNTGGGGRKCSQDKEFEGFPYEYAVI